MKRDPNGPDVTTKKQARKQYELFLQPRYKDPAGGVKIKDAI
jgi:hypothetical protein